MTSQGADSATATYRSYAKINLYLDVLSKREDGYHNIETIFQSVGLWDELAFQVPADGVKLSCTDPTLPVDDGNLVVRAAHMLRDAHPGASGAHITLKKQIPVAAGLAGGSGNAAATLIALNQLWTLGYSMADLTALAARLGSDVPYCLSGGPARGIGRGNELESLTYLEQMWFVLVHPPFSIGTADLYTRLDVPAGTDATDISGKFVEALARYESGDVAHVVYNALEPTAFALHPELATIKETLLANGCLAAAMSGTGPTIFGLCNTKEEAEATGSSLGDLRYTVAPSIPYAVERIA